MNWAVAGLAYVALYSALIVAVGTREPARVIVGNIGLLLPPLAPLAVLIWRRGAWHGRQAVFWGAIGAWAALWFIGQIGWAADELFRATPLPWFKWHIILQLSGSALPLIALVAWPHRPAAAERATTVALDIAVLVFLTGFLYWSLIIAPGMYPAQTPLALRMLAIIGPLVRLSAVVGLLLAARAAGKGAWATTYQRLALGLGVAFVILVAMSFASLRGDYRTGSVTDAGWMLPFFFAAWAASTAPASPARARTPAAWSAGHSSPVLLFAALLTVTVVGYSERYLMPLGPPVDDLRELATAFTLVCGGALVMIRLRVEQRAVEQANQRVRLLATAAEQAGELIIVVGRDYRIDTRTTRSPRVRLLRGAGFADADHARRRAVTRRDPGRERYAQGPPGRPHLDRSPGGRHDVPGGLCRRADLSTTPGGHAFVAVSAILTELRLRERSCGNERLSALGGVVSASRTRSTTRCSRSSGRWSCCWTSARSAVRVDLERTRFEAGRAGRIVRNLLTFVTRVNGACSRIERDRQVDRQRALRTEMAAWTREEYSPLLPLVLANREEIQQVILHLIINAQQAMTATPGPRVLSIRTSMIGGDAVLEVRDTGPGVPADAARRIFEPFFTTKTAGGGSGLGLSLSLGIANAHRGTLDHLPTESGSCFRLTLPGAGFPGPASIH
jgi:signal transduction histidine kinase